MEEEVLKIVSIQKENSTVTSYKETQEESNQYHPDNSISKAALISYLLS